MTDDVRPPFSRRLMMRVMPVVFRVINVPMRFVLGLHRSTPLGKRLMLVYLTGRKTVITTNSRSAMYATGRPCLRREEESGSSTSSKDNRHTYGSVAMTSRSSPNSYVTPRRSIGCWAL